MNIADFLSQTADSFQQIALHRPLWGVVICYLSGLVTSLTPCVYPMIPVTISVLGGAQRDQNTGFSLRGLGISLVYVGGLCTTYSTLGVLSGLTGSLFGGLLQSPWILGCLVILFVLLALSQFGLFSLELPSFLQQKLNKIGGHQSLTGIFLMGIIAGLIISPCVGPIVAGILTLIFKTSQAWLGFVYFFSFSLGLGTLFLVIGSFSGFLNKLPKSGNWMKGINIFLGTLLLLAAFYYLNLFYQRVTWKPVYETGTWTQNIEEAFVHGQENNKPILIDFTAVWCTACHEFETNVFSKEAVKKELRRFVTVRIDVTAETPENKGLLNEHRIYGLPSIIFFDSQGNRLTEKTINGLMKTKEFLEHIQTIP